MEAVGSSRPVECGALRFAFIANAASFDMVVDQPHRLHESVDGGRTDERPTALFQIPGDRRRCIGLAEREKRRLVEFSGRSSAPGSWRQK